MASYPSAFDALTDPTGGTLAASGPDGDPHHVLHSDERGTIRAIEAALGLHIDHDRTFEDAGGSAPDFGALDQGSGAVPNGLGVSPVQQSAFTRIGGWCFGHCRLVSGASGATAGTGVWSVLGLPVTPFVPAPVDNATDPQQARTIGWGFLLEHAEGVRITNVRLVADPVFSSTDPILWADAVPTTTTIIDPAKVQLNGVTGALEPVDPGDYTTDVEILQAPRFSGSNNPHALCTDSSPFAWSNQCFLNLFLAYQAGA